MAARCDLWGPGSWDPGFPKVLCCFPHLPMAISCLVCPVFVLFVFEMARVDDGT